MRHFVKLYESILDSSVWDEGHATVRVWVALLVMADADGNVRAARSGLRRRANVSADELAAALDVLEQPDPDDSSGVEEGRRVLPIQGGWFVVNHRKYREMRTERQVKDAVRKRRKRSADKADKADTSKMSADSHGSPRKSAREVEVEVETKGNPTSVGSHARAREPQIRPEVSQAVDERVAALADEIRRHPRLKTLHRAAETLALELLGALGPQALEVKAKDVRRAVRERVPLMEDSATERTMRRELMWGIKDLPRNLRREREQRATDNGRTSESKHAATLTPEQRRRRARGAAAKARADRERHEQLRKGAAPVGDAVGGILAAIKPGGAS